jgi:carbon storage regulator CsrA
MLVLRRKVGQRIKIGDDVEITVLKIQGGKTRLGITAPRDVHVSRVELPEPERTAGSDDPAEKGDAHAGSWTASETNHIEATCESLR